MLNRSRALAALIIIAAIVAILALSGCGDSPAGPGKVSIDGTWSGMLQTIAVTMTITEAGGSIGGTGSLAGPGGSTSMDVTGTRSKEHVSMKLSAPGYLPTSFTGTIDDRHTMSGNITGSGFTAEPITLTRR